MSLAHLPADRTRVPRAAPASPVQERLRALLSRLDSAQLGVAEEVLEGLLAQSEPQTRGLTDAELDSLARLGVSEAELLAPTALPATTRGLLWERQSAEHSVTVSEAAEMLGVTPARIRQRCAAGSLLAQRRSDGWHLPLFQFPDGREPRGWAIVAQAIPRGTPLLLAERVLTSPAPRLCVQGDELAPLEWLAQGGDPARAASAVDDALNRLP